MVVVGLGGVDRVLVLGHKGALSSLVVVSEKKKKTIVSR